MSELKFRVEPYGSSGDYYSIEYREEFDGFWSILNFLIPWTYVYRTYHIGLLNSYPDKYFPALYSDFDSAVRDAEKYKNNPKLLKDFIESQTREYDRIYKECEEYRKSKNKSKII
jgi:hypothetical protein